MVSSVLLVPQRRFLVAGPLRFAGRKAFFSEEKKQKTYTSLSRFCPAGLQPYRAPEMAFSTKVVVPAM
jgi:hypothetical protein